MIEAAPVVEVVREPQSAAGQPAALTVRVHHGADGPRDLTLTVLGLDGGWAPVPARIVALPPRTAATVELELAPPAGTVAAAYPFVVAAQSSDPATGAVTSRAAVAESVLTVDRPAALTVSAEPGEVRTAWRRGVRFVLTNAAPEPATVDLELHAPDGLRAAPRRHTVEVPGRAAVAVGGRVGPRRIRLTGDTTRYEYTAVARGPHAPAAAHGVLVARPLIGSAAKRAVALAAVLAVWAAAAVVGLPRLVDRLEERQSEAGAAADTGADGDGSGSSGGDGSSSGDSGGEGAGGDEGAQAEPVRVSGVVEADRPDGVTVSIAPTAAFGEAGEDAKVAPPAAAPGAEGDPVDRTRSTVTNEDGAWAFAGLGAGGHYLVTVSKAGFQTERRVVDAATAAEPIEVELRAGDGRLSGTVTGPEGPVGGAELTLTDGTVTVTTSTSTTGDVGSWAVDGLSTPSTYLVTATAEGLGAGAALVELDPGGDEAQDLALRRGVATLTGHVTGRDGTGADRGLGGVTVTADDGETTRTATTATTGDETGGPGLFTLPDLPLPGRYTVTVAGEGYQTQTREVTLAGPGQAVRRLDTRLVPAGGEVLGAVTDAAGTPLAAGLTLSGEEGAAYKVMSAAGTGAYRISGVTPGSYVLTAEVFGHVTAYARVEVTAGSVATADLVLTPIPGNGLTDTSVIVGRAVDASTGGGPVICPALLAGEECLVTVATTATGIDGEPRELTTTFAPDASYTIPAPGEPGLLPGLYELTVTAPGYEPERLRVEVPMDATVNAPAAALLPAPSILGTITARVGNVPDGTCVVAVPAGVDPEALGDCVPVTPDPDAPLCRIDGGAHCAFTGLNGSYELTGLPSGGYDVSVRPGDPEYRPVDPVTITLFPGDVRRYDAVLDRLGRLRVSVQANDGEGATQPAAGATVRVLAGDEDVTEQVRVDRSDEASGVYAVTHLQPGVQYRVVFGWPVPGADPPRVLTGEVVTTAGLNNEIPLALTLTGASRSFTGQVVHELDTDAVGVDGVQVQVTGIVGYDGLLPVYRSATAVTDADGLFAVVPEPGQSPLPEAVLPIVDARVDVTATKDGYERSRLTGVAVSDGQQLRLTLTPTGRPVQGRVQLVPAAAVDLSQAELMVTAAPPGAEATRIAVTPGGCLVWSDPAQRVDTGYTNECGEEPGDTRATLARPGRYTVEARLPGYADVTVQLDVALATTGGRQQLDGFVLSRHGALEIATVDAEGEPVYGARLVLGAPGVPEQTRAAEPGTNRTVFTELPSLLPPGGQYSVRVEAAGYRFDTFTAGRLVTGGVPAPDATPLQVPPDGVGAYQLALVQLGEISGVLRAHTVVDGEVVAAPLVGAAVVARHESGLEFSAVSGPGGGFTITGSRDVAGLLPGTWEVRADPPDGYTFDSAPLPVEITADHQAVYPDGNADPFVVAVGTEPVDVFVNVYVPGSDGEPPQPLPGMTVELLRGGGVQTAAPCDGGAGCYRFTEVPPVPQTLRVSGENYAPLTLTVRPEPGAASTFNVPVTQLTNTIQGTVSGQSGANPAEPLDEADTWLCRVEDAGPDDRCPAADGDPVRPGSVFEFTGLADGTYLVDVRPRAGQPYTSTTRTVTVAAGQIVAFDVVLYAEAEPITVTAESVNGWDLTGALVSLISAEGDPAPAPQPVVRAGGDEYTTTFAQVPPGDWTATLTGPAGHAGVHESGEPDGGGRDLTIEVTEVRVRMDVRSAEPDAPGSVAVTITDAGDTTIVADDLLVDAGTVSAYLPAAAYTVAAELPDGFAGWTVAPLDVEVPDDAADVAARFTLAGPPATALELAVSPAQPVAGVDATLTATVTAGGEEVDEGTVTFLLDGEEVDTVDVDGGTAELEHAFGDPGGHTVEAVFEADEYRGSEDLLTVTVIEPEVTLTGPAGDVEFGDPVELVATVDPVVSGRTLRLFDDDGPVGSAVSPGADGEHEFTVEDLEPGEHTFTVRYGTGQLAVESEPVTVTVAEEDPVVDP